MRCREAGVGHRTKSAARGRNQACSTIMVSDALQSNVLFGGRSPGAYICALIPRGIYTELCCLCSRNHRENCLHHRVRLGTWQGSHRRNDSSTVPATQRQFCSKFQKVVSPNSLSFYATCWVRSDNLQQDHRSQSSDSSDCGGGRGSAVQALQRFK